MVLTAIPRPLAPPRIHSGTSQLFRPLSRFQDRNTAGKVLCLHCNHRVVSLEKHYTYDLECAIKEGSEIRADLKLRNSLALNFAGDLEGGSLDMGIVDEEMEDVVEYDWRKNDETVHMVQQMAPHAVQHLRTVPLEHAVCLPDLPRNPEPLPIEAEEMPTDQADGIPNPQDLPIPKPSPPHIPEPSRSEPAGKTKFPQHRNPGAPYSKDPNMAPVQEPTIYADWADEFKRRNHGPIYGPFSESDWEFARWAKRNRLSAGAVNSFLKIRGVSPGSCYMALPLELRAK